MRTRDTTFEQVSSMTLPELFERRVEETPDALAVRSVQGDMTFGDWWMRGLSIAELLRSSFGSLRGERVALWFTNDEARTYVAALQSVFEAGAISMGLDDRYAVPELQRLFDLAEPRVLVMGPQLAERLGPEGFEELGLETSPPASGWDALALPIAGRRVAGAPTAWAAGDADGSLTPSRVAAPADDAMIAFTSGSTGTPKGPIWSQAAICQYAERVSHCTYAVPRAGKALTERDVLQSPVPLYTAASLIENVYPTVFSGCELVFEGRRFDAAASEERMARHGTTVYNGVPAFFAMMCDLPERRPGAAPELMIMSGSALTEGLYRRMRERWPTTQVANWYGLNESGSGQTLNHGPDMERHPSSIGRPLPPTEIRVVDADLNPVAAGTEGDLLMRAPGQMREYFRSPEQTAERFRGDWLFTGDRAFEDEDGLFHIVGRNEDRINRGGFKFYPAEVVSALATHDAVQEAAVIAVPHDVLGQEAIAFVVKTEGGDVDGESLRRYCRTQIAPNKAPAEVIFIDDMPRAAYGKVNRRKLLELYEATRVAGQT
jgi:acyl-CoA synthetase (AMP-forming)/AMP-acid ligase II